MSELTAEDIRWIKITGDNCKLLGSTYTERIEYIEAVKYHVAGCKPPITVVHGNNTYRCETGECPCPSVNERRVRNVRRKALLDQLADFSNNRDCDLNPKGARGAPRVKKAKINPELNGFLTLDEITCDIYSSLDRIFEEAGRNRTWLALPVKHILPELAKQVKYIIEEGRPDLAPQIGRHTDKWVAMAKRTLNHNVAETMFANVVCENCGGALAAPNRVEGETAVVKCVGTPTEPPCGHTYPASEWLRLYEGRAK